METVPNEVCRLCLVEEAGVSEEHVPARSTGNWGRHEIIVVPPSNARRRILKNGVYLRVLCQQCNEETGGSLGSTFADFAKQIRRSGAVASPRGGWYVAAAGVYPARIHRLLLLNFLCIQQEPGDERFDSVRDYIRSRDAGVPDAAPRVHLYYNSAESYRIAPVCSLRPLGRFSTVPWVGSEIAFPGLGVIYTLGLPRDEPLSFGQPFFEITDWGEEAWRERQTVSMTLPRLHVAAAYPLAFGSGREVDAWLERNQIAWLMTKLPMSEEPSVAVWRPARRK